MRFIYLLVVKFKIAHERESKIRDVLEMMGLQNSVRWMSWFISSCCMLSLGCVIMTTLLRSYNIFENSDPVIVFIILELFAFATVATALFLSLWFSQAKIAAVSSSAIYLAMFGPFLYYISKETSLSVATKLAMCLFPPSVSHLIAPALR